MIDSDLHSNESATTALTYFRLILILLSVRK
uniref:Uncharacterized protein n=1 Tax=Rhizophora mucronata TaxID=61149 RepID=A0A2P2P7H5_RHIMU